MSTTITTETQETDAAEQVAPAGTPPPPVTREAEYPQSPERVWKALTDPDALEKWLLPTTDFAPEPGRRFTDRYSLDGAATAMDAATVGCARAR